MAEVKITNMVKFYAMLLLHEKPRHGYELIHCIGEKLERKISPGQIYPFLEKLQKNNLVELKAEGEREKKIYALSKEGKIFSKKLLVKFGTLIDLAIEPKLTVCAHCGCKIYGDFHKETIRGKMLRFCCCHCAKSFKEEK